MPNSNSVTNGWIATVSRSAWPAGPHVRAFRLREDTSGTSSSARRNHYRIAMGSAAEVAAVIDLVDFVDGAARQEELRRVAAMLFKMAR